MSLFGTAQIKAIEAQAIENGKLTQEGLIKAAALGAYEAIATQWPELFSSELFGKTKPHCIFLIGPSQIGAIGFALAGLLYNNGWKIEIRMAENGENISPFMSKKIKEWTELGEIHFPPYLLGPGALGPDLIVDAVLGADFVLEDRSLLKQVFTGPDVQPLRLCDDPAEGTRVLALELPSGLCGQTGTDHAVALPADLTVAFHCLKAGHVLGAGPDACGNLVIVQLGLEQSLASLQPLGELVLGQIAIEQAPLKPLLRQLGKRAGHKFSYGHALVLGGAIGRGGAARLAARAALRVGAGVVTLAVPPEAIAENAGRMDAIMLQSLEGPEALRSLLMDPRINALCLGPNLGLGTREARIIGVALAAKDGEARPTILDADALRLIAQDPWLFAGLHHDCVLTPHMGEFAQLFPDLAALLRAESTLAQGYSKIDAVKEAARRADCVVLLKGADTVIACPKGRCAIHVSGYDRTAPWLATAGAGDVLSGLIAGLLARGFAAFDAALLGAWLHVECAYVFGPGLIAEDISEVLPQVLRRLRL